MYTCEETSSPCILAVWTKFTCAQCSGLARLSGDRRSLPTWNPGSAPMTEPQFFTEPKYRGYQANLKFRFQLHCKVNVTLSRQPKPVNNSTTVSWFDLKLRTFLYLQDITALASSTNAKINWWVLMPLCKFLQTKVYVSLVNSHATAQPDYL